MNEKAINKILMRYVVIGIIFVSLLGTLDHFFYDWSGKNAIIGLFSAVNESTWEHMKLIFFPMLLYSMFIWLKLRKNMPQAVSSMLISTILATCIIPVLFYTYTGILGYMITAINLSIFYISVISGFILFYYLSKRYKMELVNIILYLLITLFTCMFFLFTYNPPDLGIFIDPTAQ